MEEEDSEDKYSLICKCCSPPRDYESPVLLSVCDHIVCRHTVVQMGDTYVCPLCKSSSYQLDTESHIVRSIAGVIEHKFICKIHYGVIEKICWTCNTSWCRLCKVQDCNGFDMKDPNDILYAHDVTYLLNYIEVLIILERNIKMFIQDNSIKIQDNLDLLEQDIRNNNQIITRLRELKQYIKNRIDNHYLPSLETEFSILESHLSSSINQLTETKQNITKYLDNFNSKKSSTQSLVQVLDWLKEKNILCRYKIYSSTIKEYDIIDQLLNSYYTSQQNSPIPLPRDQQQFIVTLNECFDIKESIDARPLICYPIVNSYKFFDFPRFPIVEPINNSQLDLFLNSQTTPRKNNQNENDNNSDNNINNIFVISYKYYHFTRLFYYISKCQFNYLFFFQSLDDYKKILIKLDINFSALGIVGDRQLIELFYSSIRNLTSVLIIYHGRFYDRYKYEIQYNKSNIKTIIITDSDFKANHPNVNIFGEYVLEPISKEALELMYYQTISFQMKTYSISR